MSDEYVPTLRVVRGAYVGFITEHSESRDPAQTAVEFSRWLAAHDAALLARVREGIEAEQLHDDTGTPEDWGYSEGISDALAVLDRLGSEPSESGSER